MRQIRTSRLGVLGKHHNIPQHSTTWHLAVLLTSAFSSLTTGCVHIHCTLSAHDSVYRVHQLQTYLQHSAQVGVSHVANQPMTLAWILTCTSQSYAMRRCGNPQGM
jgi:hypothetical protein